MASSEPLQIVLVHPEIPHNAGAIGRLCVGLGIRLHLVRPLGFQLTDRLIKRAGLDYWEHLDLHLHSDWDAFLSGVDASRIWLATTKAGLSLYDCTFSAGDILVFGSESAGLPDAVHARFPDRRFAIPMPGEHARSLNLAQAAAVAAYEAHRQIVSDGAAVRRHPGVAGSPARHRPARRVPPPARAR